MYLFAKLLVFPLGVFFALCLRGGSSPCDLVFAGLLSGVLVEQPF